MVPIIVVKYTMHVIKLNVSKQINLHALFIQLFKCSVFMLFVT